MGKYIFRTQKKTVTEPKNESIKKYILSAFFKEIYLLQGIKTEVLRILLEIQVSELMRKTILFSKILIGHVYTMVALHQFKNILDVYLRR